MSENVEWTHKISLLLNNYIVMDVLFVLLLSGGGVGFLLFLIMGTSEIYAILEIVTIATGILIVLAFLSMGVVMLNHVEITFILEAKGIKTEMQNPENKINKIALYLGLMTGKLGLMGSSMFAMYSEKTFVIWSDVKKVVIDGKNKVISLSSGDRMLVRLFCNPELYPKTVRYVEKMLPGVEMKRI